MLFDWLDSAAPLTAVSACLKGRNNLKHVPTVSPSGPDWKFQSTAMAGDDFCADCEPEARTVAPFRRKKWFQNPFLKLCWNPWTCVADLYIETVCPSFNAERQSAPVWHCIYRVTNQICDDLSDLTFPANDWRHIVQPLSHNSDTRSTQRTLEQGQR